MHISRKSSTFAAKFNNNNMKYIKFLICLLLVTTVLVSCEEQNWNLNKSSVQEDTSEYYVKYSIVSPGLYRFSDIYFADVSGTVCTSKDISIGSWTITIGPVKKGFFASVRNEKGTGNNTIEVSKNNSPFAVKASGTNKASYKIDY